MDANWKFHDYAPGEGLAAGAFTAEFDSAGWLDISVPGDVHSALLAAGRIEDPFYDQNENKCAWIEEREWWYRLAFSGPLRPPDPDERLQLVFHGLDTFATVWLNGIELGRHKNMFTPAVFDVTRHVRPGQPNTLALCFDRPLDYVAGFTGRFGEFQSWGPNEERVFMRKAQFGYGWDWGPRLPTVGIWRPVELRRECRVALVGAHGYTLEIAPDRSQALVAVKVEIERFAVSGAGGATRPLTAHIDLSHGDTVFRAAVDLEHHTTGTAYITVPHPALWWTHDLGDPNLYDLRVVLRDAERELDRRDMQIGIRTIELDQSPDPGEPGTRFFRFVLNGVPLFAKGANWIPADSFFASMPLDRYDALLKAARRVHMNMLRIWGGGLYEHDHFYDLCDQLGLLVWQDFMFACAIYPDHVPEFAAEVEAEARYQVRRLRNHPSMALWCGNNENQWIHDMACWKTPGVRVPGELFYNETLPNAVADLDGHIPYWPGSPYGGNDHNSMDDGDRHNWDVWHGGSPRKFGELPHSDHGPDGVSYRRYTQDTGRFISEFGMHASPVVETLRRVIPEDQLYHHSHSMDHHNKDNPKNKGDNLMLTVTGLPENLDDYIDFSMITQAEGLKYGIEHFRRRKPHCSGTLFWQFNDCWPVLSWSVVDYYGIGKAAYYYARRFFAPVLASFKELPDGGVELWLTNDTLQPVSDRVAIMQRSFDGSESWGTMVPVLVLPNSSQPIWRSDPDTLISAPDHYLRVRSTNNHFPPNRHFFAPIKDLKRDPQPVTFTIDAIDSHTLNVQLAAPTYALFVNLSVPHDGTRYSDNYFDLQPGEKRTITITNTDIVLQPEMVRVRSR
ncbi:MAG: glycoside hydrolase family 2 protein [Anaerolineae bacterium]|nr:glycoside hydrolase family 2 protein [Anaerolineae bacterium]